MAGGNLGLTGDTHAPWLVLAAAFLIMLAPPARAEGITVFAAASTADAMEEVARLYEAGDGGRAVRLSFASSSTLARQIENGAPADLYLSANSKWMDYLAAHDLIEAGARATLFTNTLVLIAPRASPLALVVGPRFPLAEALGSGLLAMGDPDHVPAGVYGKEALTTLGVWSGIEGRVARAADVRAALALVARGEAAAGITYATDAAITDEVRVVAAFPRKSHAPVRYELSIIAGRAGTAARAFFAYLSSGQARAVFARHGFAVGGE